MCICFTIRQNSKALSFWKQKNPDIANNIITSDSNNYNFVNILNHSITVLIFEKQKRQNAK